MKHSISQVPAQKKRSSTISPERVRLPYLLFHIPININILFPFPPIFRTINDRTTKQTRLAVFRAPGNPNIQFKMFEVNIYQHLLFYSIKAPIISTFPHLRLQNDPELHLELRATCSPTLVEFHSIFNSIHFSLLYTKNSPWSHPTVIKTIQKCHPQIRDESHANITL